MTRVAARVAAEWGGVQTEEIEDIIQSALLKLSSDGGKALRRVQTDTDEGALAYVKRTAAHAALDYFKMKYAGKRGRDATVSLEARPELTLLLGSNCNIDRTILLSQIDSALRANPVERSIFWLYYRDGFTAKEISSIPSVNLTESGVESLVRRLILQVKNDLVPEKESRKERRQGL